MIGRMCKVGDGLSRPVLIARETFSYRKISRKKSFYFILFSVLSSNICRGYSGEEPPLPIPNREVKLTIADGTAPPGGRVGSCGFLKVREYCYSRTFLFYPPLLIPPPVLAPAPLDAHYCPFLRISACCSISGCAISAYFAHPRVLV